MKLHIRHLSSLGLLAACGFANAATILNFSTVFAGATPTGGTPWARLTLTDAGLDGVNGNKVDVLLENLLPANSGQFITELELNLTTIPANFATKSPLPSTMNGTPTSGGDFITDAGEKFDVDVKFKTANGSRLNPGQSAAWSFTGTGLQASDFLAFATPQAGNPSNITALLHVQGLANGASSKVAGVPVPEPLSLGTLGLGLLGLLARRRRA